MMITFTIAKYFDFFFSFLEITFRKLFENILFSYLNGTGSIKRNGSTVKLLINDQCCVSHSVMSESLRLHGL